HDFADGCRFGYPRPSNYSHTYLDDESGRYVMKRREEEHRIVGYNMELLRFAQMNMDLQYNSVSQARKFKWRNISKQAGTKYCTMVGAEGSVA
ncbi:hypothetical protein BGZ75_009418, partial [Mortierella antarctica]